MYTVLLVDDQELFRDIARSVLEGSGLFRVVGEAIDGLDAVAVYPALSPDVVLMDVRTARLNALEATRLIRQAAPGARVVLTTIRVSVDDERAAAEAGALALIARRDLDPATLLSLVEPRRRAAA